MKGKDTLNVFARKAFYYDVVQSSQRAKTLFSNPKNALICIDRDTVDETALVFSKPIPGTIEHPLPESPSFSRVLILFTELPVEINTLKTWKEWIYKKKISEYKIDFLRIGEFDKSFIEGRILRHCRKWEIESPKKEETPENWGKCGGLLNLSGMVTAKDSPDLLTAMFGSMGEMMMRIYDVHERFISALKGILSKEEIEERKKSIREALANPSGARDTGEISKLTSFPKLLLYGETGVGKTLVSRYLHNLISSDDIGRPLRISIPEYVGKEADFEYALFGYAQGAYTGGLATGSPGLLIENMGKVVFLDEIEEANSIIQAKLLAFLDDYRVRPRGWLKESFFCPVLVVAATNCRIDDLRRRHFRNDLLARFTDIETIPPLRERKESMDFIIDCLLQLPAINPKDEITQIQITEIGKYALEKLKEYPYMKGNFRELEDVLRNACTRARKDGRYYLCECDILFE